MGKIVGILSMQKVLNYGSFLQAYALKQLLLKNGAGKVYFIDIKSGRQLPGYSDAECPSPSLLSKISSAILSANLCSRIKDFFFIRKALNNIKKSYCHLGLGESTPSTFDLVVVGSDEVFNCCQHSDWGYTLQLYGDIPEANKVISYAASFGHTTLQQLKDLCIAQEIGTTLSTMCGISVRDKNSQEIVTSLTNSIPQINVDPVLAYGYKKEMESYVINEPTKYIVLYSYHSRITDKKEVSRILEYSKKYNLKIYSIFCRYDWCDKAILPQNPFEVLAWIKNSEYVITDTFHGTVFSIITSSQFATIIRNSNQNKLLSLLKHYALTQRIIDINTSSFETIFKNNIDYDSVGRILESDRCSTNNYLGMHLANC